MSLGFGGEVTEFYHRYRRGYPPAVFDALTEVFGLSAADVVLDLGCGTGQLARPIAARVRAVLGMDPEPDMLVRARRAALDEDVRNVTWLLGGDADVPALGALLGGDRLGVTTIGQALHWMESAPLFRALWPLSRPGGGVAVVTNGEPLWLQATPWSRALRDVLEGWLGTRLTRTCGTDEVSRERYRAELAAAGYQVDVRTIEYAGDLDVDTIVGGVFSAMSVDRLPAPERRAEFAARVREALAPHMPFVESVRVRLLTGRVPR
ncbi:class I SAM-dependent methyltransferase [Amycolatopsis sp. NPDC059027]|uniref:class I SAM-dependent methyltransferase n=1 Tax=unclassified Amycolatopsis TaxID=2618356 RepID=UPI00366A699A